MGATAAPTSRSPSAPAAANTSPATATSSSPVCDRGRPWSQAEAAAQRRDEALGGGREVDEVQRRLDQLELEDHRLAAGVAGDVDPAVQDAAGERGERGLGDGALVVGDG